MNFVQVFLQVANPQPSGLQQRNIVEPVKVLTAAINNVCLQLLQLWAAHASLLGPVWTKVGGNLPSQ